MAAESQSFAFLNKEEDLYTLDCVLRFELTP